MAEAPAGRRRAMTLVGALVVAPLATLVFSAPAQAAELTPVAQYLDKTIADTEAQLGAVLDALGLKAA